MLSELKVNHNSVDRLACIVVHFHIQAASSTSYHRSTASWQLAKRSKSVKSIQAPSSQLQPAAEGIMKHWHWSIHSTPRNARDWTGQQRMHGCIPVGACLDVPCLQFCHVNYYLLLLQSCQSPPRLGKSPFQLARPCPSTGTSSPMWALPWFGCTCTSRPWHHPIPTGQWLAVVPHETASLFSWCGCEGTKGESSTRKDA